MSSAEGGAGSLHRTTPAAWRGGLQAPEELEEDVKPMRRCEERRREWPRHRQCDSEVQCAEDKPWRNQELRSLEEELPQLSEENLERAATSYRATMAVGRDGFHPRGPSDLSKETREKRASVDLDQKVGVVEKTRSKEVARKASRWMGCDWYAQRKCVTDPEWA